MNKPAMARRNVVSALLESAVADGVTPGLAAKVIALPHAAPGYAQLTSIQPLTFFVGRTSNSDFGRPVTTQTRYDLASLTKIFSTTLLTAHAVSIGKLDLDETPWPQWTGVTVAHILRHQSGLPAWKPFFEEVAHSADAATPAGKTSILQAVLRTHCEAEPGSQTTYSDLGFIALGALLEERLGMALDDSFNAISRSFYGAPGMRYVSLWRDGFHPNYGDCAPTEACPWRKRVVQGQVHDDNAFGMGGVAGHAGLFGTLNDVAEASLQLLHNISYPTTELARILATFAGAEGARGLGFDRPSPGGTTGQALSPAAFGHLGFTGTSVWMDPASEGSGGAIYVLLTNRVHPKRDNPGIRDLRIAFHEKSRDWVDAVTRGA